MSKSVILVPTDFSEVADAALDHATKIATISNSKVILLHVVSKKGDIEAAKKSVSEQAQNAAQTGGIEIEGLVRIGSIFEDIGDAASETGSKFIVMGTHGLRGMQHIMGGHALKVITHSAVPFIVVQRRKIRDGYKNIILPVDLSQKTKQKLRFAVEIAKYFSSTIHVLARNESDEQFRRQINNNMTFAKKYLQENNISYSTKLLDGDKSFGKGVLDFAKQVNADLISIMNLREGSIGNLFGSASEQQILTNEEQIPVMIVNPKDTTISGGAFSA